MDGYSLNDALDYVKLYPEYVEIQEQLLERKKQITLTGDLKNLAQIEYMIGALSPWNCRDIEKKMKNIEVDYFHLHLPGEFESDLHAVDGDTLSYDFIVILKEAIKQGNLKATDVYSYYLAHINMGYGNCTESDDMGSKLIKFLEKEFCLIGRAHLLKVLNMDAKEAFSAETMKETEESCPAIKDMRDIHALKNHCSDDARRKAFAQLAGRVEESSMAKYGIGFCYYEGIVVDEDSDKAEAWFRWAAAEGCCSAQNRLVEIEQSK